MDELTIERLAALRAYRDTGEGLETAAERVGTTVDAWQKAEPPLLEELDEDFTMGRTERLERYDREYRRVWAELTGAPPQTAPARGDNAPAAIPSASPVARAAAAPAFAEATYQKLAAAPPAPLPSPAVPVSVRSAPPINIAATAEVDLSHIIAALPFRGDASNARAAPARSPLRRGPPVSTGTVEADPKAVVAAATPFEEATPAATRRGPPALAATAEVDFKAFRALVTPFEGQRAPPPAPPPPSVQRRGPPIPTGTVMADERAPVSAATPFAQPSTEPALSVEQYAELTAMLTKGANPDATFKRFGMNAFQYSHLVSMYSKKFAQDPALKSRFEQLKEEALRHA